MKSATRTRQVGEGEGTIRSFIAIELDPVARDRLGTLQADLRAALRGEPIRWVRPDSVHLTLKFLGGQSGPTLQEVERKLVEAAQGIEAFDLAIAGIGCFPNAGNPRVIWAGVLEPSGRLGSLVADLESSLTALGLAAERRPFEPHLTLGRVKERLTPEGRRRLEAGLAALPSGAMAESRARSVDLIRSDLRPDGPVYTVLRKAPFRDVATG